MWLFRMQRIWRIKVVVTAFMLAGLIIAGGHNLAQMRQASQQFEREEREEREERRIERRFEAAQKSHDELKFNIETRLVKIETYMSIGLGLLGVLGAGVLGQWGMRLFDLISQRRAAKGDSP